MEHRNIFPVFEHLTQREEKEKLLKQHAIAVWMCGLSGSGKTTVAIELERALFKKGFICQILDADNIRTTINKDLGFSLKDREENIRRISEINKLFLGNGMITINCFISPTAEIRAMAKEIIGKNDFVEVFLNAPLEVCRKRDPKGLYNKADSGKVEQFTGVSSPFENPEEPAIEIRTDMLSVKESTQKILDFILPMIEFRQKD
jgi:adenylylsulfate kinase